MAGEGEEGEEEEKYGQQKGLPVATFFYLHAASLPGALEKETVASTAHTVHSITYDSCRPHLSGPARTFAWLVQNSACCDYPLHLPTQEGGVPNGPDSDAGSDRGPSVAGLLMA